MTSSEQPVASPPVATSTPAVPNLDELCTAMAADFQVSGSDVAAVPGTNPRLHLYKNQGRAEAQTIKRRELLLKQRRQQRFDQLGLLRRLARDDWTAADDDDDEKEAEQQMEADEPELRPSRGYQRQLMLSEWLLALPTDLSDSYLLKLCPVGRRVLVVAAGGRTRVYNRRGRFMYCFASALPGGARTRARQEERQTVLDGVLVEAERTIYLLDVMAWHVTPFWNCDSAFRFYWLASKFEDELQSCSSESQQSGRYRFALLPELGCTNEQLAATFSAPAPFPVDGLLFYHRDAHYAFGHTPLVSWLKPYMIPEMLPGVGRPHASFMSGMPSDYVNYLRDIESYETTRQQLKEQQQQQQNRGSKPMNAVTPVCSPSR